MARPEVHEEKVERISRELLKRAGTKGRFPTPVDDIIGAAGLLEPKENILSDFVLDEAPPRLRDAVRSLRISGRIRALLDRKTKEVHVDPTTNNVGQANFQRLHEVGHSELPWHQAQAYVDDAATLSHSVNSVFEQQASIAASNLLFQLEAFDRVIREYVIGFGAVLTLKRVVGASGRATFRRYVERHDAVVAGVVLDMSPRSVDPLRYSRLEAPMSSSWMAEFGNLWPKVLGAEPYSFINDAEQARTRGGVVATEFSLANLQNETEGLNVELFCNQYNVFALIWKPRREVLKRRRIVVSSPGSAW